VGLLSRSSFAGSFGARELRADGRDSPRRICSPECVVFTEIFDPLNSWPAVACSVGGIISQLSNCAAMRRANMAAFTHRFRCLWP
jgi:hypothetical protein